MFVIIYNNFVILGPMKWNKLRFQSVILNECNLQVDLMNKNDNLSPIIINENLKILPVRYNDPPQFNSKIEFLHGPFWEFTSEYAIASYIVLSKEIEVVKNELKQKVANERWIKEVSGIKLVVQNVEVTIDTNRGARDIFIQKHLLMGENDTVFWKFPECWLNLTKTDLGNIVNAGVTHVQEAFEWEANLVNQIEDPLNDLASLNSIHIESYNKSYQFIEESM